MPATVSASAPEANLIIEEDNPSGLSGGAERDETPPWRILIVDDNVDVHVVTKFALSNAGFQGRRLSFLHAYNSQEALDILRKTPDIALVLLDVIMETDDAGLRLARQIREELHNELVRIVLRTGQPGQALEHSIIVDYDISDFWCKTDLTTRKLFTTVISSLRTYAALARAAGAREALNAELAKARQVQAAVNKHALVLTLDTHGRIVEANDRFCEVFKVGREQLIGHDLQVLHARFEQALADQVLAALAREGGWAGVIHTSAHDGSPLALHCTVLAFKHADGAPCQYVAVATPLDPSR